MYLKMKECDSVNQKKKKNESQVWVKNNSKAINYIHSAITSKQMELVSEEDSTYRIIEKFDQLYPTESNALKIICRNRLEGLRLKDFSDTATFLSAFEKGVHDLKNADRERKKRTIC